MSRPRRNLPRWRVAFVLLLAGGAAGTAAWLVLFSSVLGVRQVAVTGTAVLSAEDVRRAAGVPPGEPLARVDVDEVRARVAALRRVESARVERIWPGTLRIRVVERAPVAVAQATHGWALVDRYGVVVEERSSAPLRLPRLRVARLGAGDPATRAALAVLTGLPPALAGRVEEVRATSARSVSLRLSDGRNVVWGGPERGDAKARILLALLARPADRAGSYDVSSPDVVTVK